MAFELVEAHGLDALHIAANRFAALYHDDPEGKRAYWREVMEFARALLEEKGLIPRP